MFKFNKKQNKAKAFVAQIEKNIREEKAKHRRNRARSNTAMNSVDAHVFVNALRRWIDIHGDWRGRIQARELSKFYNSPGCKDIEVPKGGALKLIRKVENSGLLLTHDPKINQWIIKLDNTLISGLLRWPKLAMKHFIRVIAYVKL